MTKPVLETFLWFDQPLDDILDFYVQVFGANVKSTFRSESGAIFAADFSIYGHDLVALSAQGGPKFTEAISLSLKLDGQAEVDRVWDALTTNGGQPGNCGWCIDPFGVSWQVTPAQMQMWLQNEDETKRAYAWKQLMQMHKIVLDDLHE